MVKFPTWRRLKGQGLLATRHLLTGPRLAYTGHASAGSPGTMMLEAAGLGCVCAWQVRRRRTA